MENRHTPAHPSRHGDKGGLTKREECAIRFALELVNTFRVPEHLSETAVEFTDALFDELEKSGE